LALHNLRAWGLYATSPSQIIIAEEETVDISQVRHHTSITLPTQRALAFTAYGVIKRLVDLAVSVIALVILSPLLLGIAIVIKLDSRGPVIYRQKRVRGGQNPSQPHPEQQVFEFLKFRSMHVNADTGIHRRYVTEYINGNGHKINNGSHQAPVYKMKNDPRITRVGRFLRRTSLDELPQLFNILRGDMSLVGPRPALPYEVEQYQGHHKQRLTPQAGLTGLWQVSGRTSLTFEQMVELDIAYSQSRSLWLDLRILLKTLPAVISGDGAW
jgi:lipopolysaccharide/colanic/teichoic acid biosynthesis glycosyltransferase